MQKPKTEATESLATIAGARSPKKINYPGSQNYSQFTVGPMSRNVKVVEVSGGSTTSTKQFVWCIEVLSEARDGTGAVVSQYFRNGQTLNGVAYFYTLDLLGSIREATDNAGASQLQLSYSPYGVPTSSGSASIDFQYASYYVHSRSGLNIALYRAYNPSIGRWLSRDPIEEEGGINLFAFVSNNPISNWDPFGTDVCILTAPRGFSGSSFGHTAVMVGNDSSGWNFYSKSMIGFGGRVGGPGRPVWFPDLDAAKADPRLRRYTCYDCYDTTEAQDDAMNDWARRHLKNPYFPFFFNCVNFALGVAGAGGVNVGNRGPLLPNPTQQKLQPDYKG